jgi:hypothetical protein
LLVVQIFPRNFLLSLVFSLATDYIRPMNFRWFLLLLLAGTGLSLSAATAPVEGGMPYATIMERNVFGLVPLPTNPPDAGPPKDPPPKITPNGIMTVFGKLQVLFKVSVPGKPNQPAKDESYVMCEGDRQDEIEVQKIDEPGAVITFNNHGEIQKLPLVAGTGGGGPPAGGTPPPVPGMGAAGFPGAPGAGFPGAARFGRNRPVPTTATPPPDAAPPTASGVPEGMTPTTGGFINSRGIFQPAAPQMSPEQQVLMIEAQRMKFQQEGNPLGSMLPPTAMTEQLKQEAQNPQPQPEE